MGHGQLRGTVSHASERKEHDAHCATSTPSVFSAHAYFEQDADRAIANWPSRIRTVRCVVLPRTVERITAAVQWPRQRYGFRARGAYGLLVTPTPVGPASVKLAAGGDSGCRAPVHGGGWRSPPGAAAMAPIPGAHPAFPVRRQPQTLDAQPRSCACRFFLPDGDLGYDADTTRIHTNMREYSVSISNYLKIHIKLPLTPERSQFVARDLADLSEKNSRNSQRSAEFELFFESRVVPWTKSARESKIAD